MSEDSENPALTVAIPSFAEADNLQLILPEIGRSLDVLNIPYEILVIDAEEPQDNTEEICLRQNNVRYVNRTGGSFYGHAVRSALNHAQGEWIIFMDADGSHHPSYLPKLWNERNAADLVIASRYIRGGGTDNPLILIFMSMIVNIVFRLSLGFSCKDISNSFRLYRGSDVRAISLDCKNFEILEEILVKLYENNPEYQIKEIPFHFEKRKNGKTKRNLIPFIFGYATTVLRLKHLQLKSRRAFRKSRKQASKSA